MFNQTFKRQFQEFQEFHFYFKVILHHSMATNLEPILTMLQSLMDQVKDQREEINALKSMVQDKENIIQTESSSGDLGV